MGWKELSVQVIPPCENFDKFVIRGALHFRSSKRGAQIIEPLGPISNASENGTPDFFWNVSTVKPEAP